MQNSQIEIEAGQKRRLPRLPNFQWHIVVLLHCVVLTSQYCTEYFESSSPVVSTSLQYLFSTQIGIGLAVMLTLLCKLLCGGLQFAGQ